jgi:LysR family nitrogen assimilation transcriptional regulator
MDIRQLRYFVAVVEAGSFTKAAVQLHVAQSALSLHIRQLEQRFGTALLVRDKTGVRTTDRGTRLLTHAQIILRQLALAEADLTSTSSSPAGEVTLGVPSGAARVMVSDVLAAAAKTLPNVSLKIVEGMTGQLEQWMTGGRFDLAVLYRTTDTVGRCVQLAREELYLIANPVAPPFATTIELANIHSFPLAVPRPTNYVRRCVSDIATRLGYTLDVRFEVDSLSSIIAMVIEGRAYSILTLAAVHNEVRSGLLKAVKIVNPLIPRSVVLATNPRDERTPAVVATRELIVDVVHKLVRTGYWPAIVVDA